MFLIYHVLDGCKMKYTTIALVVFSIGIILNIKIEAKNNEMHQIEQMYGSQFYRMGKMIFIEITGQLL